MADLNTPESEPDGAGDPPSRGLRSDPKGRVSKPSKPRRAKTEPPPGSDPKPAPEPKRHASGENDDRLRGDKPPHY